MKLTFLKPHWIADGQPGRTGMGVSFYCPVHGEPCRLGVYFENPIDGGPKFPEGMGEQKNHWWQRTGTTFKDLSLIPSIHVQDQDIDTKQKTTHWHGHITNGEVI